MLLCSTRLLREPSGARLLSALVCNLGQEPLTTPTHHNPKNPLGHAPNGAAAAAPPSRGRRRFAPPTLSQIISLFIIRRWQSTHGRQALKKTAVPEPARELPLAKQARALRRPHAAGCPGRCAIAPAGWMANLWRGARGRGGTARHSTWSTSRGGSGKEILNARSSGTLP